MEEDMTNAAKPITNIMEDFNQPSPERVDLLQRLQSKAGDAHPHFWAACQICDLDALKKLAQKPVADIQANSYVTRQVIRHWGSSPGTQSRPPTPMPKTPTPQKLIASNSGPSPSTLPPPSKKQKTTDSPKTPTKMLPRDANVKKQALERDNFSCVLTGQGIVEVAHIYPHHSIKQIEEELSGPRHLFWNHLSLFWPEEKVTAWERKLFPNGIIQSGHEEVYNLISLSPDSHRIWGRGLFALKPISESNDKKTLTVQFFWQKAEHIQYPKLAFTTTPVSTKGLNHTAEASGVPIRLFDKNDKKIESGDCFQLQTDDPISKPLPSFELLELQWFLHRIQSMAGAADIDGLALSDSGLDSDSEICEEDYDVPDLEQDVVEEFCMLSSESPSSPRHLSTVEFAHNDLPTHPKHHIDEVGGRAEDRGFPRL